MQNPETKVMFQPAQKRLAGEQRKGMEQLNCLRESPCNTGTEDSQALAKGYAARLREDSFDTVLILCSLQGLVKIFENFVSSTFHLNKAPTQTMTSGCLSLETRCVRRQMRRLVCCVTEIGCNLWSGTDKNVYNCPLIDLCSLDHLLCGLLPPFQKKKLASCSRSCAIFDMSPVFAWDCNQVQAGFFPNGLGLVRISCSSTNSVRFHQFVIVKESLAFRAFYVRNSLYLSHCIQCCKSGDKKFRLWWLFAVEGSNFTEFFFLNYVSQLLSHSSSNHFHWLYIDLLPGFTVLSLCMVRFVLWSSRHRCVFIGDFVFE